jgi:hypothetical protein
MEATDHDDDHNHVVPLSNLFASIPLLSDLPIVNREISATVAEYADSYDETAEWCDAATHTGVFRSSLTSGLMRRPDLQIDIELTTPAGEVVDGEPLIDGLFHDRAAELAGSSEGTVSTDPSLEFPQASPERVELSIEDETSEYVHARGSTRSLERDVQHRILPVGLLSVDTTLRLADETKPSAVAEEYIDDDVTEPLDTSTIDSAEISLTVIERMITTLQSRDPTDVVFGGGHTSPQPSTTTTEPRTIAAVELTDADLSALPFSAESTYVTVRETKGVNAPARGADELPSHVAVVEIDLTGPESVTVDSTAEATVWIPLSDAERSGCSHTVLAEAVAHHSVEQYEWSTYRGETDYLAWHVWDPEEHTYVDAPAPPTEADSSTARTHQLSDGERLVCPITDTDACGITRVRPCGVGVIEVSCHTRLFRPSANRILGPVHDSRQALYAPLWTNVAWYSRQLVDALSKRTDGLTPHSLRLARHV